MIIGKIQKKVQKDAKNVSFVLLEQILFLEFGNKNSKIMFIGEGPGADEDAQGEPFVGKAGQLMNKAFEYIGINRNEIYIANIVKCRPPNNRNPEDDEAEACLDYLRNQVLLVKPKIIVLLGSVALQNILGKEFKITASRGKWFNKKDIKYMPTWHPAALLRDENKKFDFWNDLELVKKEAEKNNFIIQNKKEKEIIILSLLFFLQIIILIFQIIV